jgi:hypothetical protein
LIKGTGSFTALIIFITALCFATLALLAFFEPSLNAWRSRLRTGRLEKSTGERQKVRGSTQSSLSGSLALTVEGDSVLLLATLGGVTAHVVVKEKDIFNKSENADKASCFFECNTVLGSSLVVVKLIVTVPSGFLTICTVGGSGSWFLGRGSWFLGRLPS